MLFTLVTQPLRLTFEFALQPSKRLIETKVSSKSLCMPLAFLSVLCAVIVVPSTNLLLLLVDEMDTSLQWLCVELAVRLESSYFNCVVSLFCVLCISGIILMLIKAVERE